MGTFRWLSPGDDDLAISTEDNTAETLNAER
jgi:hypothetical protein